jgi:zinc protease
MYKLFLAFLFLQIGSSTVLAAENVSTFDLNNGLKVVVIEDHRAPVVVHMLWYKVGAADEETGRSGVAHFLEHLLFKATNRLKAGEFSSTVERNGGSDNAFTSWDYTAYYQRISSDRLGLMMQMEADRMKNIRLTDENIGNERKVVLEERAQRIDSNPGALFSEQRQAVMYMNHPYGIPVIGWRHEMEQLNRRDTLAFYKKYYAPNAAILVVAGDVSPADVKKLASRHYGSLRPTIGLLERKRVLEPPHLAERRIVFEDERVAQPYVVRSYLVKERNAGNQGEAAALTMLAELLGGNQTTSVFGKALQIKTKRALYSSAFYSGLSYDETSFGIIIVPSPGRTLGQAEEDLDEVIKNFVRDGVDEEQLRRIKMQIRASHIYAEDDVFGLAKAYGSALTSGLSIADIQSWPEKLSSVTSAEILTTAELLLDKRKSVTGWYKNQDDKGGN